MIHSTRTWDPWCDELTSLEDLGWGELTEVPYDELDTDELDHAPMRPRLRRSAYDWSMPERPDPFADVEAEPGDTYAKEWELHQLDRQHAEAAQDEMQRIFARTVVERWPVTQCATCESMVRRSQYAQHWMDCSRTITQEEFEDSVYDRSTTA